MCVCETMFQSEYKGRKRPSQAGGVPSYSAFLFKATQETILVFN